MTRKPYLIAASVALVVAYSAPMYAQGKPAEGGRLVVVKLVSKGGSVPYAFEPANVTAQQGDTLRFVEGAGAVHNVHFKTHPGGARLGAATEGPYLTSPGQTYDIVIDGRFTDGKYEYVCDPHEMIGMRGTLTVEKRGTAEKGTK